MPNEQEPIIDGDGSHLVPLDQWPTVIELPPPSKQKPTKKANANIVKEMAAYDAAVAEGQRYLQDVARATEGMLLEELNAWCAEMEAWNDAVAGEPRHATEQS
jgi:hypothetical protein